MGEFANFLSADQVRVGLWVSFTLN
jgi:hypothetical protein